MANLEIAKLWRGLDVLRAKASDLKQAGMLQKAEKAEHVGEAVGDLITALIEQVAALSARIEKLEGVQSEN